MIWNTSTTNQKKTKMGMRNIIWFIPPFSKPVSTNVAKIFLQLVTKHFPRSHKLHKIFNRNTVKVSYSCMNNMSKIIKGHNKKVTSKPRDQRPKCNCRKKAENPMKGSCQVNNVVYKGDATRPWYSNTTTFKYLKEMSLLLIWKKGNSYLSKPEGTLE